MRFPNIKFRGWASGESTIPKTRSAELAYIVIINDKISFPAFASKTLNGYVGAKTASIKETRDNPRIRKSISLNGFFS